MGTNNHSLVSLIHIHVPPLLEYALGCTGEGRYIAYWVHPRDGLCWSDGSHAGCCNGLDVWCDYINDLRVAPHLDPFDMGSEQSLPQHWLILDRKKRRFRVGELALAAGFMRAHRAPVSLRRLEQGRRRIR